ncbi:MAG: DUF116 domain-containing protein [Candidatus Hodarchaeales archaeon]
MPKFPYNLQSDNQNFLRLDSYFQKLSQVKQLFETQITPKMDDFFQEFDEYSNSLQNQQLDVNYTNPMIHTPKQLFMTYMLLIEYSNQFWKSQFDSTPKKIVVLPRCLTGENFNLLKVKRTKIGWHRITGTTNENLNAWKLTQICEKEGIEVFITMGRKFKEPSFPTVFKSLRKRYGNFGLVAVACIPELALGNTFVMEMAIPSHAVPIFYSGCAKWHGSAAIKTEFPLSYLLDLLKL